MPIGILAGKARVHGRARRRHLALRRRLRSRGRRHLLRRHVRAPSAGARRRQGRAAASQGRRARRCRSVSPAAWTGWSTSLNATSNGAAWRRAPKAIRAGSTSTSRPRARSPRCSGRRCACSASTCRKAFPASSRPRTATPTSRRSRAPSHVARCAGGRRHPGETAAHDERLGARLAKRASAPLTEPQLEILTAAQMGDDASCAFNESVSIALDGELDPAALEAALNAVIARHDALRGRRRPQRRAHAFRRSGWSSTFRSTTAATSPIPRQRSPPSSPPTRARRSTCGAGRWCAPRSFKLADAAPRPGAHRPSHRLRRLVDQHHPARARRRLSGATRAAGLRCRTAPSFAQYALDEAASTRSRRPISPTGRRSTATSRPCRSCRRIGRARSSGPMPARPTPRRSMRRFSPRCARPRRATARRSSRRCSRRCRS